jgi:hypothetical protein
VIADMADREERFDIELMDRVDFHPRGISGLPGKPAGLGPPAMPARTGNAGTTNYSGGADPPRLL